MKGMADILAIIVTFLLILLPFIPPMGAIRSQTGAETLAMRNMTVNDISAKFEELQGEYIVFNVYQYYMKPVLLNCADKAGWELISANQVTFVTLNYGEYVFHRKSE